MRLRISYVWSSSSVFKGRKPAEANAEPSQSTDSNEKGEQGSINIGIRRLGGGHLYYCRAVCEISRVRALPHAAARWLGGVLRRL